MLISIFITCYNDALFPESGKAVVEVLERLGHTVEFRAAQTCCGQMHYNTGYREDAHKLLRHFCEVFETAEVICCPSSSCVAMMRDHYPKMAAEINDPALTAQVAAIVPRIYEFAELLVDKLKVTNVKAFFPHTVTLHSSCHALRSLHIGDNAHQLLNNVAGLTLKELPDHDQCCGFGGTFAVKNPDVSAAMASDKIQCILSTKAEICTGSDNSCLMHIGGALTRQRTGVRTMHLAEILAQTDETV